MSDIKITFNATVSNVIKFEKTTGKSLLTAFSADSMDLTTIVELIKALSDADDEKIDAYVKANGFEALSDELEKALVESGFLPKDKTEKSTTSETNE